MRGNPVSAPFFLEVREMMNDRRFYFLKHYRTLGRAASELKIDPSAFSVVINGLRPPTDYERIKLLEIMSPYMYRKLFAKRDPTRRHRRSDLLKRLEEKRAKNKRADAAH